MILDSLHNQMFLNGEKFAALELKTLYFSDCYLRGKQLEITEHFKC